MTPSWCKIHSWTGKLKPLVILGSARPDGETRRAVDLAFPPGTAELVVLPDFAIGGYDYAHGNADDGFAAIAEKMAAADGIVFATPVYWYAMSAPLKIFFDRLTDMTQNLKPLGKALAGKPVWVIATGEEDVLPDGFEVPFDRTATYLGMAYQSAAYLCTAGKAPNRHEEEAALSRFGQKILGE
jgi:putative NADPH-quinone reductase